MLCPAPEGGGDIIAQSLLNIVVDMVNVLTILDGGVGNDGRKGSVKFGGEKL